MAPPAHQAEQGMTVEYADDSGSIVSLKADAKGLIHPKDGHGQAVLDSLGLPRVEAAPEPKSKRSKRRAKKAAEKVAPAPEPKTVETVDSAPTPDDGTAED